MACERISLPEGRYAIVCGSRQRKRCACGKTATRLCDWKVDAKRSRTCDAPICGDCATSPAPNKDLCAKHGQEFEAWKAQRQAAGGHR